MPMPGTRDATSWSRADSDREVAAPTAPANPAKKSFSFSFVVLVLLSGLIETMQLNHE